MKNIEEYFMSEHKEAHLATPVKLAREVMNVDGIAESFEAEGTDLGYTSILMIIQAFRQQPRFGEMLDRQSEHFDIIALQSSEGIGILALDVQRRWGDPTTRIIGNGEFLRIFDLNSDSFPGAGQAPWIARLQRPPSPAWAAVDSRRFVFALRTLAGELTVPAVVLDNPTWRQLAEVDPPVAVENDGGRLLGSVGIKGLYKDSDIVTTAGHCVDSQATVVVSGKTVSVLRTETSADIALLDASDLVIDVTGVSGIAFEAPGLGNEMTYNGFQTGKGVTRITGVDPGVLTNPAHAAHVYTAPDPSDGDSGSALVATSSRCLVGLCREETSPSSRFHATSWVWAAHALEVAGVVI